MEESGDRYAVADAQGQRRLVADVETRNDNKRQRIGSADDLVKWIRINNSENVDLAEKSLSNGDMYQIIDDRVQMQDAEERDMKEACNFLKPTIFVRNTFGLSPMPNPAAEIAGTGIWGEEFRFDLHRFPTGFLIGRKLSAVDLDLSEYTDDRTVSHRHCMIVYNRKLSLFQLESYGRNGTRVNGIKTLEPLHNLNDGDMIEIGGVSIKFSIMNKA